MNSKNQQKKKEIDWMITLVPLALIVALCIVFFFAPEQSNQVLGQIRFLFGDTFGTYYLVIGLGIFFLSLFLAGSKYGNIVLGKPDEKPKYSFFAWGCMMFTCGLAADILFYSFSEWILYATDPHIAELGSIQNWAGVFPLFHWSFIPWGFYLVLAVAFGFMLHVRKRNRQKYSEACRPILGKQTDGIGGRLIDLLAVFALLAGTATTFSVATPLMAEIIGELFHMEVSRTVINIIILLITCCVYTYSLLHGFKGISILAKVCIYLFFGLLAFVLLFGGETRYIIETGFSSLGKMIQNFIGLSTYTDPMRTTNFPQNWTIYYWAYWMVWCVAAPFFIGSISRGRTVRQTILGGYGFGVGSTLVSFIILGNYSMGKQISGAWRFISSDRVDDQNHAVCTADYGCCISYDGCILCDIVRLDRIDGIVLQLPETGRRRRAGKRNSADVVYPADPASDCTSFCREFHEQSAVCQYRSGISDRHCDRDDCGQLLKRCKTVFRRIAGRKSAWRGEKRESLN